MRTSALFGAKNSGFFEIYGVSARTSGVEPVQTFFGGGSVFLRFCANVLNGRPLTRIRDVCLLFLSKNELSASDQSCHF